MVDANHDALEHLLTGFEYGVGFLLATALFAVVTSYVAPGLQQYLESISPDLPI